MKDSENNTRSLEILSQQSNFYSYPISLNTKPLFLSINKNIKIPFEDEIPIYAVIYGNDSTTLENIFDTQISYGLVYTITFTKENYTFPQNNLEMADEMSACY